MFFGKSFHLHLPTVCCMFGNPLSPPSSPNPSHRSPMANPVRIAVVGDVHDDWNLQEDTKALQLLQKLEALVLMNLPSSCLQLYVRFLQLSGFGAVYRQIFSSLLQFLDATITYLHFSALPGDFGNENVELVRSIADLKLTKAAILGNHDAWRTQQFAQRQEPRQAGERKDRVQLQLECLGEDHVGYRRVDYPSLKLSIVGGRPFSCGGEHLFRKALLDARYGVQDMDGSAKRIYEAALGAPEDHSVILLAHNGPTGLGSKINDICGRDWVFGGGDHGDPDLAHAISHLKETTQLCIPLVVFGHMHKELAYGNGLRKMIVVGDDNTIYLNGAIVPRVKRLGDDQTANTQSSMNNKTSLSSPNAEDTVRAFTLVEISGGKLKKIAENWVSVTGDETSLQEEHILYRREHEGTENPMQ
ncbi:hypothetical protein RHSIM_Rhsim01G0042700 [Rhododendron simsii]|uniref:Calcineurin-like phosphoesterase domain-containing protein n=1 Tax=Rhododendron simsii TaxID=118357 RepID=A0A834HGW6_RHOSS|nr:hypothetical protein RHSIM_Rhsim01G0042700 [Rhododendron simsii]